MNWEALYESAAEAAQNAYAPYSKLQVGAAAITKSGKIVTGCNVENASFGLTLCAECGLVSNMHSEGHFDGISNTLEAIAVVDGAGNPLTPCGRCRQLLLEAGGEELLVNEKLLGDLLPGSFKPEDLPK